MFTIQKNSTRESREFRLLEMQHYEIDELRKSSIQQALDAARFELTPIHQIKIQTHHLHLQPMMTQVSF